MSSQDGLLETALAANRVVLYIGFVLLAGVMTFWVVVWPNGRSDRRLVALSVAGTTLLVVGTLGGPLLHLTIGDRPLDGLLSPLDGTVLLVRLAALSATAFFLADLVTAAVVGWRRAFAAVVVVVIAGSFVVRSSAADDRWITIVVLGAHLLATAAWIGGLVALAAVLAPGGDRREPNWLVGRFSLVAVASVITLVVSGILDALVVAGGPEPLVTSVYGAVLLVKVAAFALLLVWGENHRRQAVQVGARGTHTFVTVTSTELVLVLAVLVATSVLVGVAPTP